MQRPWFVSRSEVTIQGVSECKEQTYGERRTFRGLDSQWGWVAKIQRQWRSSTVKIIKITLKSLKAYVIGVYFLNHLYSTQNNKYKIKTLQPRKKDRRGRRVRITNRRHESPAGKVKVNHHLKEIRHRYGVVQAKPDINHKIDVTTVTGERLWIFLDP